MGLYEDRQIGDRLDAIDLKIAELGAAQNTILTGIRQLLVQTTSAAPEKTAVQPDPAPAPAPEAAPAPEPAQAPTAEGQPPAPEATETPPESAPEATSETAGNTETVGQTQIGVAKKR